MQLHGLGLGRLLLGLTYLGFHYPGTISLYHRNDSVPSHNTVLLWVRNFRETAFPAKRKNTGREPSLRTPENIE